MRSKKIIIGLFGLIVLSIFVIGNLCQGHDVAIDEGYGVNGIKIRYNSVDITDDPAHLLIGNSYELRFKGVNIGEFDESKVNFDIVISFEDAILDSWERYSALDMSGYTYKSIDWDTTGLTPGIYTIIASAFINDEECDHSNNERKRTARLDYDDDNDGVLNILDKCPDSMLGEEVDENGCDPFQFCKPFYCSLDCFYADWKGNENKNPNDCTMVIVLREENYEPRCVPLSCAD